MSRNTDIITNAIRRKIGGAGTSQGMALKIFSEVTKEVFAWLKNQTYYQNRTFNLSDSIGFGIYDNGVLAQCIPLTGEECWKKPYREVLRESVCIP